MDKKGLDSTLSAMYVGARPPPISPAPARAGRYELGEALGAGAMGVVYRARDPELRRAVAIKLVRPAGTRRTSAAGLLREAQAMAQLRHRNVVPIFDVGMVDGAVFVAMPLLEGGTLRQWLRDGSRSLPAVLDRFVAAGTGLVAAHAAGLVHRDFKPDNVLLSEDGEVLVADFGLARLADADPVSASDEVAPGTEELSKTGDVLGTPAYMPPEQLCGQQADARADQFSFCVALWEGLYGARPFAAPPQGTADLIRARLEAIAAGPAPPGRDQPAWIAQLLVRGLDPEPEHRWPSMQALLDAIAAHRAPRRSRRILALVTACVVVLGVVALERYSAGISVAAEPCALDPTLFAGRWDPVQRVRMAARLATAAPLTLATVLAEFDGRKQAILDRHAQTCRALRGHELAAPQVRVRTGCLERRAFELGAVVKRALTSATEVISVRNRVDAMPEAADCDELVVPAPSADRAATAALYRRWVLSFDLGTSAADAPARQAVLQAIERDAAQLGDPELAARAALALGLSLRFDDRLGEADAAVQRAYRAALDLHATNLTANALIERCAIATLRGDATSASQLAELAEAAADKPIVPPRTRARLRVVLGRAALGRGDFKAAIARLEDGITIIERSGRELTGIESEMRFNLTDALVKIGGRSADAVRVARDNVALLEHAVGVADPNYGVALNMLAYSLSSSGDVAQAVGYRRQALAVMQATQPPDSSHLVLQHADVAADLWALGELEAAHREIAGAVAQTEHNQTLAGSRAGLLPLLAIVTFDLGRHADAVAIMDEALEGAISQFGKDHPTTLEVRWEQIRFELELGQIAEAERHLAELEAMFRARGDLRRLTLAHGWFGSTIAIERGQPELAERAARDAIGAQDELHRTPSDSAVLHQTRGRALIALRRWAAARAALDQARRIARDGQVRADAIAAIDVDLARLDAQTGRRAAARTRASAARRVLDKFPGQVIARRQADALAR